MEGIFPGKPAAAVPTPVASQGQEVFLLQAFHPTNGSKTWNSEEAQVGQEFQLIHSK